jgi:hypothetical protein
MHAMPATRGPLHGLPHRHGQRRRHCGPAGSPTAVPFGLSPLLFGQSTSQRPSALPGYNRDATNVHDWDE